MTLSTETTRRVRATESWTVEVPVDFTLIDNGDSWQAHDEGEHRIVYLGSLLVADRDGGKSPRAEITTSAEGPLAKSQSTDRHSFQTENIQGSAVIEATEAGYRLVGFVAQDGSLVTCLTHFDSAAHREWAIATWKSVAP